MGINIQKNILLSVHTTLQVGGVADGFVPVKTKAELKEVCQLANETDVPMYVLGGGSNILFPQAGFRGLVVKIDIDGIEYRSGGETMRLRVGAGVVWDDLVADTVAKGYWGLENLSAIPGTVGATPIQNVGAYGVEVSDLIHSVRCVHKKTLAEKIFSNDDCGFGYRDSYFKSLPGRDWIVTEVCFTLSTVKQPTLSYADLAHLDQQSDLTPQLIRDEVINIRSQKFPDWSTVGTAGSFFKNPVISAEQYAVLKKDWPDVPGYQTKEEMYKVSLGWILDKALHLKGFCQNNVCLYQEQALVLVNHGADSDTVSAFYTQIQTIVKEKIHIQIEPEVQIVKNG